ncbi:hypothetical protein Ddye_030561 [Dipteronia dyeriana]|uniref:KIB1-4 beta-propeller domain-containing protein n=1 Tax=Dipteronia dyeriana TaxID=168575 RepID=A0AAD9TGJ4_9ROSI|nr:hypothetical protein Ddye_030561 [Dipteronia dyeriana]
MTNWTRSVGKIFSAYSIVRREVCIPWRSAAVKEKFMYKDSQMPWFMLAPEKCINMRDFISISKGQFYSLDACGHIMVCDVGGNNLMEAHQVATMPYEILVKYVERLYIVGSGGEFLVVSRETAESSPISEESRKSI